MTTDIYLIQLHGGGFDGYRQPVNYILGARLEMPGALPCPDGIPPRVRPALYELRRSSIELVNGLPTMVLDYHFVGMRVGRLSAAITRLVHWRDWLAGMRCERATLTSAGKRADGMQDRPRQLSEPAVAEHRLRQAMGNNDELQ